jgi:hypothetical protein
MATSRDLKNVQRLISKNYQFQTFPKTAQVSDEARGAFLEKHGGILALITKIEVCAQHQTHGVVC